MSGNSRYYATRPASESSAYSPAAKRRQQILDLLSKGELTTQKVADQIQPASLMTIDNDLHRLRADGLVYKRLDSNPGHGSANYWGRT